ncbi:MAG TPA: ABC transporter permease subunit [Bacteroidota bacterium]|jgi:ABC-type transport system involved in multi-copper enzyme maturation permease subunit|nr:ABC transporter permease subunit [Bacteroidota bacterium]
MISTVVTKELKAIILTPKFTATFAVCSLLMLLSVYVGINEYRASTKQYETATQLARQEMREQSSWMGLMNRTYRVPDPMQIFVSGVNYDVGRWSAVNQFSTVKLRHSAYSDDPIFAVFRFVDFSFIVTVVLSLFALLFTYDAINGERESGTLQLTFSNAVPRAQYILGKLIGSWLGLVIPLALPVTLAILMMFIYRIPLTPEHWSRFGLILGAGLLYFTVFIAIGLFISAVTRHSSTSFLVALVIWVLAVLIIPRAGVIGAGQLVPVPSVAEIEGQHDAYAKQRWQHLNDENGKRWQERNAQMSNFTKEEREKYRDDHLWAWMEEDDSARKAMQKETDRHAVKLNEDLRNRQATQQELAFILSRFSPASSFQLTAMNLAGTNIDLKSRYEDAISVYRETFNKFTEKKQKESGGMGGIRVTFDSDAGFKFDVPRERGSLNLGDMPQFTAPARSLREVLPPTMIDVGLMSLYAMAAFVAAFLGFLRYDVR